MNICVARSDIFFVGRVLYCYLMETESEALPFRAVRRRKKTGKGRENMEKTDRAFPGGAKTAGLLKAVGGQLACAGAGVLLSGVVFAGGMAPFGLSLTGGADTAHTVAAAIGAALGGLLFGDVSGALKAVSAAALVCFLKTGTAKLIAPGRQLYVYTASVFVSSFVCALIVTAAQGLTAAAALLALCEAAIAAAGACFLHRVFVLLALGRGAKCISAADFAALLFALALLLLALERIPAAGPSLSHAAAGFLIMVFSLYGVEYASVTAGVCFGVTLGMGETRPHLLAGFALAGLLCGLCGDYGKPAVGAAFAVADLLALTLKGDAGVAVMCAAETAAAVAVFLLTPKKALLPLFAGVLPARGDKGAEEQRRLMRFRLNAAAKAVKEVGASVRAASELLADAETLDPGYIPGAVRREVCDACLKREFCWDRSAKFTEKALGEAFEALRETGLLTEDALPRRLDVVCRERATLCAAFNRLFCEYNARAAVLQELREAKTLAAVQFSGASAVLEDAAKSLSEAEKCDPHTATAAREVLNEFGFAADPVVAYSDARGRSTLEAFCRVIPRDADFTALSERLYEKTGFSYLEPLRNDYADRGTVLSFPEAAALSAEVHVAVRVAAGETVCGDTCRSFSDGRGVFYTVLSDGMGRGKRAAVDSAMACALTAKLVRAGFSLSCAVGAVNTALMTRGSQETLATLDILRVDLSEGRAEFFKAGAAMSAVRTGDRTAIVERSSLPLGILKEAALEQSAMTLAAGDRVVLMSDGAAVLPPQYFKELFGRMKKKSVKELAETAADEALKYSPSGKHDDITVACVELK